MTIWHRSGTSAAQNSRKEHALVEFRRLTRAFVRVDLRLRYKNTLATAVGVGVGLPVVRERRVLALPGNGRS
jgi:hypothetical protein